jgi:membrane-associated phospholipid phosphatase
MRNTLLATLAVGLLLFKVFPLMPPRLMPSTYHYVDTGREYFHIDAGLRSQLGAKDEPTTSDFAQGANDFAAMPSMHIAWSTWVVLALWPLARRRLRRTLLLLYPLSILVCVTVTANHWFLDAVGAWIVLAVSYGLAFALERMYSAHRRAPESLIPSPKPF